MKKLLALSIFLFMIGCNNSSVIQNSPATKSEIVNDIRKKVAVQLSNKKQLKVIGTGAQMMDEVAMLALSFTYDKDIGIEEARELLLSAIDTFLVEVNTDHRIHPYLRNYPFEPKNIEIAIFLKNPQRSNLSRPKLTVVYATRGVLGYDIRDEVTGRLRTIYEETYEEALKRPTDIKLLTSQPAKKMKNNGNMGIGICY